jgi:zinc transporter 5/7
MASTYALPVASIPHGHIHAHSHSGNSPSRSPSKLGPGIQSNPNSRNLRQERSDGSMRMLSRPQSFHEGTLRHDHGHNHSHTEGAIDFRSSPYKNGPSPVLEEPPKHAHSRTASYTPLYINDEKASHNHSHPHTDHDHHHDHDHAHDHHDLDGHNKHDKHECHDHDHGHDHAHGNGHSHSKLEKRSRFTTFLLTYSESSSLLHSILIEKDSRRIFYFMM